MWLTFNCGKCRKAVSVQSDWDGRLIPFVLYDQQIIRVVCPKCGTLLNLNLRFLPEIVK